MSNEKKNPYLQYDPFDYNPHEIDRSSFPFINHGSTDSSVYNIPQIPADLQITQSLHGFESVADSPYNPLSFTDCLHHVPSSAMDYNALSKAFGMSCSSSSDQIIISPPRLDQDRKNSNNKGAGRGGAADQNESPPNSSISSSSNEAAAAHENDQDADKISKKDKHPETVVLSEEAVPGSRDLDEKSKKVGKLKNKEKRQREPRFAFLTKSEVDHLEDGYRWRKYGQKAVKNSPYPRSYYRCTTQKCIVKKRVERSFQDPAVVVTTYEGQHNHQYPATLRGSINAVGMLTPSFLASAASGGLGHSSNYFNAGSPRFPHEFLFTQLLAPTNNSNNLLQLQGDQHHLPHYDPASSSLYSNLMGTIHQNQQPLHAPHDYGLLQDLAPSFTRNKEDP